MSNGVRSPYSGLSSEAGCVEYKKNLQQIANFVIAHIENQKSGDTF